MKGILSGCALLISLLFSSHCRAQPAVGSLAADWTCSDINNMSHHLYSYLDSGYMVAIDVSATWCAPCWAFHSTHVADSLTKHYGPNGTIMPKKIKFLFVEGDHLTDTDDLYGNGSATMGNWVSGTNYPIIDTSGLNTTYNVSGYPTFIAICPNKRVVFANAGNAGVSSEAFWVNLMNACPLPSSVKDAALMATDDSVNLCSHPVLVQNMWNQPLTSATVDMYSGTTLIASQPWTGNLPPFGIAGINFPFGVPPNGQGNLRFKLNVAGDMEADNDTISSGYAMSGLSGNKIRIEIKTDRYPYENSWALLDGNTLLAHKQYGLYDTVQTFTYDYTVNDGACLRFALYDVYGEGISGGTSFTTIDDGYVKLYDGANNALLASASGQEFSKQFIRHFRAAGTPNAVAEIATSPSLRIFPNPASDEVTIACNGLQNGDVVISLTDGMGRLVRSQICKSAVSGRQQLSVQDVPDGCYLLSVQSGDAKVVSKLQVVH